MSYVQLDLIHSVVHNKNFVNFKAREDEQKQIFDYNTSEHFEDDKTRRCSNSKFWTKTDDVLTRLGFLVSYRRNFSKKVYKAVSEFNSNWAKQKIRQFKLNLTEEDLLNGVSVIDGECDLNNTELENLGSVKKIGGNLRLYTNTKLEDLSGLREINGFVYVYAKNKQEMQDFINKINLDTSIINGRIVFIQKMYF